MMHRTRIIGTGFYVPPKVVTNFDLEKLMDTSDEWIRERSGIAERRFVEPGVGTSDIALEASKSALANAGMEPEDLDFIIFATLSPDFYFPGSGCLLQTKLGLKKIGALDIRTQCTGFLYGLSIADQFIKTGMYKKILVVGAEVHSNALDLSTRGRDISVLFGDGAGAVIVEANDSDDSGILSTHLHADGKYVRELVGEHPGSIRNPRVTADMIENGDLNPKMNGRTVFKHAIVRFCEAINEAMNANNVTIEDIKLIIPHQANLRITEAVAQRFGLTLESVYSNIHKYGNTTAASIPIALAEAVSEGKIQKGDYVIMVAFGSGFTWASALIRW